MLSLQSEKQGEMCPWPSIYDLQSVVQNAWQLTQEATTVTRGSSKICWKDLGYVRIKDDKKEKWLCERCSIRLQKKEECFWEKALVGETSVTLGLGQQISSARGHRVLTTGNVGSKSSKNLLLLKCCPTKFSLIASWRTASWLQQRRFCQSRTFDGRLLFLFHCPDDRSPQTKTSFGRLLFLDQYWYESEFPLQKCLCGHTHTHHVTILLAICCFCKAEWLSRCHWPHTVKTLAFLATLSEWYLLWVCPILIALILWLFSNYYLLPSCM